MAAFIVVCLGSVSALFLYLRCCLCCAMQYKLTTLGSETQGLIPFLPLLFSLCLAVTEHTRAHTCGLQVLQTLECLDSWFCSLC